MLKPKFLLTFWLAIAAIGASAQGDGTVSTERMPDQVQMSDGRTVKAMQVPRRASDEDYTYTYKGVKYTYISENNYTSFFNTSVHTPENYGWYKDDDGWFINAEGAYITAASIDEESVPEDGEVYILNDLVGYFTSHTHLGCVADQGFTGESKVKRIYFQDANAQAFNANSEFHFFIGHKAFANAPHLEKVDLMQYTTRGTNHWEAMPEYRVKSIWDNAFEGSPNAMIRVATSVIDDYRNSSVWATHKNRIISYEPSGYEIKEYGARYKCMLAEDGKTYLTNDGNQREEVMQQLRLWNADYQSFNATALMAPADNGATVYYTTIEGADADYLKSHDGVARIYNDVGSYYNYKNIAIRRGAFANCEDLKVVEFWQTNGRSENSYSDMKIVIENGAFRNCKNLKEIRLYYYVQDGDDHWETLGPEDVIPGDNIFGEVTAEELERNPQAWQGITRPMPDEFKIVVSPTRYQEFVEDPNWAKYLIYIKAADYEPTTWEPVTVDNLVYDYASKTINTASTNNVVTQELSWWNIPIKALEIALMVKTVKNIHEGIKNAVPVEYDSYGKTYNPIDMWRADLAESTRKANTFNDFFLDAATKAAKGGSDDFVRLAAALDQKKKVAVFDKLCRELLSAKIDDLPSTLTKESLLALNSEQRMFFCDIMLRQSEYLLNDVAFHVRSLNSYLRPYYYSIVKQTLNATLPSAALLAMPSLAVGAYQSVSGDMDNEEFQRGLADNIEANMTAMSYENTLVYVPDKKLVYHVYVDKPANPDLSDITIYSDIGRVYNYRTVAIKKDAFRGNTSLRTVRFAESYATAADAYVPMQLAIPDSAFAGCTSLVQFELFFKTRQGGERGLGPENFILGGPDIFAGCDSTKLKIVVPSDRKEDFLSSELWSKYKRFFVYRDVEQQTDYTDYGVRYAFAYDKNTVQKVTKVRGHKVEHLAAIGADDKWINDHKGEMGLFNDIGIFNNYKLDYVKKNAFRGNQNLKSVSCWDIQGWAWGGDTYYNFDVALQDSCFADCENLESFDLIYLCTDGIDEVKELQPWQIPLGSGVFDNCPKLMLKMTQHQKRWFEADTAWAKYKDKFAPCLVKPVDETVRKALNPFMYVTAVGKPSVWEDVMDMSILKEKGFDFLNGRFVNSEMRQFPEFKQFEWAGLDYIGGSWFVNNSNLTNIELPSTIKKIGGYAFQNCDLREIEIPAAVTLIDEYAFSNNNNLKMIRCLGATPAALGSSPFEKPEGLKIYVPAEAVAAYKEKWSDYKDFIVAYQGQRSFPKVVTTTEVGQLAEKLGLETIMNGNYLKGLKGAYWNIDSLTVSGPLNGVDVGVLRFLGGADVNNSDPTYGELRYLNLYNARLKKDEDHPYQCHGVNDFIDNDDVVDEYMFYYCKSLETVILPKEATYIGEHVFDNATNLKRLCVGDKTNGYDDCVTKNVLGLDELVFLTNAKANSDSWSLYSYDSWGIPIENVYTPSSLLGDYMGEPALIKHVSNMTVAFADETVMRCFADNGHFFPSSIFRLKNIDHILSDKVKTFDELKNFTGMTDLGAAFDGCSALRRVVLPDFLQNIGQQAFRGCVSLDSIFASSDSIPTLAMDAFCDLPKDFRIYVPRELTQTYREAWPQYADHIAVNATTLTNDIIEVTLTEPNTLAEALGLKVVVEPSHLYDDVEGSAYEGKIITSITGDYSHITKLKVNGPISGGDFTVLRFLSGHTPWNNLKNLLGRLEYIDIYDADIVKSNWRAGQNEGGLTFVKEDNVLPDFVFSETLVLKTLILPKSCTTIYDGALASNKKLESVVIGDATTDLSWDAFAFDVALRKLFLLPTTKIEMNTNFFNDMYVYHPTFENFYVRPSLLKAYLADKNYTGDNNQRTNNISSGIFDYDEEFETFGSHSVATYDDMAEVTSIGGWFKENNDIKDLNLLRFSAIDSLSTSDMLPLKNLQKIALPLTLRNIEKGTFANVKDLRCVDMLLCDSLMSTNNLNGGGLSEIGITSKTLCFVPMSYGQTDETNVIVGDTTKTLRCANYRLYDSQDYYVPYAFTAQTVENTRTLAKSDAPYTICLPYSMQIPAGARAYKLSGRSTNELIFTETTETLEALQPYLIWTDQNDAALSSADTNIPASGGMTFGKQQNAPGYSMRGTLYGISNAEAAELGAYTLQHDGKWHPVMSDTDEHRAARILPYRAYLLQNRSGGGARAIGMTLEDVTGIVQLRTIDSNGTERIYDLNGRQLSTPAKGINIINGKKVINFNR